MKRFCDNGQDKLCISCSGTVLMAKGLCKRCYQRAWEAKQRPSPAPPAPPRLCDIEGCGRPHTARGFCQMHYLRYRNGSLEAPPAGGVFGRIWQDPDRRAAIRQAQSDGAKRRWRRARGEPG